MLRHIVLVRVRPGPGEAEIAGIFDERHRIGGEIPGLLSIRSGRSECPEQIERGDRRGVTADFADRDAPAACRDRREYRKPGARLEQNAAGGRAGIPAFDLRLEGRAAGAAP
ncbi:Dabb family protein [Rhodobacteraceae bacterium 2CG4]|uniref:Dabb family protein n=1 Tax=Halovulum marinum TaxID=2662447 RepID=A0A6L5Z2Z6_9RHOB|nr:Dabb family protein [Halovulum marinum]MSU90364.1 Dabb family protein [Halovulum marinum]